MAESITIAFTGTVVLCETRFDPRHVVTIDVKISSDPIFDGHVSFLIHSRAQLFRSGAISFSGWRCQFSIDRTVANGKTSWSNLIAERLT